MAHRPNQSAVSLLLEYGHVVHSYLVSSCLHATVAELSRCNRERSKILTFQLFAEKSLPIPALKETTQSDITF